MNKIFVVNYDEEIIDSLTNERLIVKVNSLTEIRIQYKKSIRKNEVLAMVVTLPYTSLSQLDFKLEWEDIPLILELYNIGHYDLFLEKVDMIRHLNLRVLLKNKSETIYTDLKILSSLGIDCGINMEPNYAMCDDKFLDLASYYYMSPIPHATIEPFEYILRHISDEANVDFDEVYFRDEFTYKYLSTIDDLKVLQMDEFNDSEYKIKNYYSHFLQLDNCSKCPAFKICNKQMQKCLYDCQKTMNEIYELAELRNELNNNNVKNKTVCQL